MEKFDIIYLYGYSSRMENHLKRLIHLIKAQAKKNLRVGVVFIHNGVIGTSMKGRIPDQIKALTLSNGFLYLFTMIADLKARGIHVEDLNKAIRPIEYGELVDLLDNAKKDNILDVKKRI